MAEDPKTADESAGIAASALRFVPFVVVSAIAVLAALRLFGIAFNQVPRWYAHGIVVAYVVGTPLVVADLVWSKRAGRREGKTLFGRLADIFDFFP